MSEAPSAKTGPDPFDRPDTLFNVLDGWTWIGCYGGYYLQADALAQQGFEHGFFTRLWRGRDPEELAGYISVSTSVHRPKQIHSGLVLEASQALGAPWPEADGLVSDGGSQSLWVCGADCTPVLIADPTTGHTAACHAGWRGVAARILPTALDQLEARGARRENLLVALGPAVSGARYQVGDDVVTAIAASIHSTGDGHAALVESGAVQNDTEPDRYRFDLRTATVLQLEHEGLNSEQISRCPLCTAGEPELFHSWRRDQVKAVQWSGIVSQAEDSEVSLRS